MAKNTGIGSRYARRTIGEFSEARKVGGRFGHRSWIERLRALLHPGGETQ